MKISSYGDTFHEMSNPFFLVKNISLCNLLKILHSMLSVKLCLVLTNTCLYMTDIGLAPFVSALVFLSFFISLPVGLFVL